MTTTRRKRFYKPRWRNPGKAWEPRSRRQERKYRTPKVFTRQAEWRYSNHRMEEREKQARQLLGIGAFFARIARRLFPGYRPPRIDGERYIVEGE